MPRRFPPVHALSAFEAAARAGSFAVAAQQLCITPSALSHRIRLLEEFVGDRLFIRDGRNLTLSTFGRSYLDVVVQALRTLIGPTIINSFRCSALGNSVMAGTLT